eukprot:Lankesteria_metandrocarpae@DN4125_c0_g1_i1.p1
MRLTGYLTAPTTSHVFSSVMANIPKCMNRGRPQQHTVGCRCTRCRLRPLLSATVRAVRTALQRVLPCWVFIGKLLTHCTRSTVLWCLPLQVASTCTGVVFLIVGITEICVSAIDDGFPTWELVGGVLLGVFRTAYGFTGLLTGLLKRPELAQMLILGMHILVISRLVDIVCQWLELCGALQAEDFTIERLVLTTIFELLLVIFCFCWVLGIFNSLKLVLLVGGTGWECRNYQELQQDFTAGIIKRRIVRTRLVFGFIDICSSDCFKDVVSSNTALTQAQHTATCCPSTQPKKHDHDSATNRLQNLNNCKRSSAVEANILHSGVTTPALYSTSLTTTTSDASTALPVHLHIESPSSTDGCSPPSPSESQNTNALFTDGDTGGDLRRAHNGPWAVGNNSTTDQLSIRIHTPVQCVHTPVQCVHTPVQCVHTPVQCVHTPVQCVHTPVQCVHTPVQCVHTPVQC